MTCLRYSSSAIGKFSPKRPVDHFATILPSVRSTTASEPASGRFTNTRFPLKSLRVPAERNIGQLAPRLSIDPGQAAAAMTHEYARLRRVEADIIGVFPDIDTPILLQVWSLEDPHRAVPRARDVERIEPRHVAKPLRLSETGDPANQLWRSKIDHAHAPVAELRHEQPPASEIDRHVIDPP